MNEDKGKKVTKRCYGTGNREGKFGHILHPLWSVCLVSLLLRKGTGHRKRVTASFDSSATPLCLTLILPM